MRGRGRSVPLSYQFSSSTDTESKVLSKIAPVIIYSIKYSETLLFFRLQHLAREIKLFSKVLRVLQLSSLKINLFFSF
jgi:hypothetical protein